MIEGIRKIQLAEKDILRRVIEICNSNQLTYFVVGGTLLGAVRHKGFIPWDDDIDISMPRPDYDRFIEIACQELKDPYQLNSIRNRQNGFCYYYVRAENKRIMLERNATKLKKMVPVWIDIFPLDGVPEDISEVKRWIKKGNYWRKVFNASQYSYLAADNNNQKHNLNAIINNIFYKLKLDRFVSTKWAWEKLNSVIKSYDYNSSTRIINFCGRYGTKEIVDKSVFGKGVILEFEDLHVYAPEKYFFYLTQIYGDFMKLPPESERVQHNIKIVETRF